MKICRAAAAIALLTAMGLLGSGCVTEGMLAKRVVRAPNQQSVPKTLRQAATMTPRFLSNWRVPVGPPAAELAVAVLEPGDYHLKYDLREDSAPGSPDSRMMHLNFHVNLARKPDAGRPVVPPKGTLVLLHGIMMNKESMLMPWGAYFAENGYRVVIVDLRGHGGSTGDWIGYGAWEGADLRKVADELQRRGLMTDRVGVFGISYGATMALHWAAQDSRVAAIVALAPFSDPRQAIGEFAHGIAPRMAASIGDAKFAAAEERAAALAGFNWAATDVPGAMRKVRAPVLFFHGSVDTWILPAHSEQLFLIAPKGSRRELLLDNHLTLSLRLDPIGAQALAWFEAALR
jgi:pimeloyl-ACP methyl ester carboxylesterase